MWPCLVRKGRLASADDRSSILGEICEIRSQWSRWPSAGVLVITPRTRILLLWPYSVSVHRSATPDTARQCLHRSKIDSFNPIKRIDDEWIQSLFLCTAQHSNALAEDFPTDTSWNMSLHELRRFRIRRRIHGARPHDRLGALTTAPVSLPGLSRASPQRRLASVVLFSNVSRIHRLSSPAKYPILAALGNVLVPLVLVTTRGNLGRPATASVLFACGAFILAPLGLFSAVLRRPRRDSLPAAPIFSLRSEH